jgi:hypothetical protein
MINTISMRMGPKIYRMNAISTLGTDVEGNLSGFAALNV